MKQHVALLLLSVASHIAHHIGCLLFFLFFHLLRVARLQLTEKSLQFFPVVKAGTIHLENGLPDHCCYFALKSWCLLFYDLVQELVVTVDLFLLVFTLFGLLDFYFHWFDLFLF